MTLLAILPFFAFAQINPNSPDYEQMKMSGLLQQEEVTVTTFPIIILRLVNTTVTGMQAISSRWTDKLNSFQLILTEGNDPLIIAFTLLRFRRIS